MTFPLDILQYLKINISTTKLLIQFPHPVFSQGPCLHEKHHQLLQTRNFRGSLLPYLPHPNQFYFLNISRTYPNLLPQLESKPTFFFSSNTARAISHVYPFLAHSPYCSQSDLFKHKSDYVVPLLQILQLLSTALRIKSKTLNLLMPDQAPANCPLLLNQTDLSFPQITHTLSCLRSFAYPGFSA